jgi:hypothetical protein
MFLIRLSHLRSKFKFSALGCVGQVWIQWNETILKGSHDHEAK